jgi:hypothetical protein
MQYYKAKGSLEGFNGGAVLQTIGKPYIKDTWFMHTVLGGTQQWNAQIRSISATDIQVRYTAMTGLEQELMTLSQNYLATISILATT